MSATPLSLFWILVVVTLAAAILIFAFAASLVIQQRRLVRATRSFGGRVLAAQEDERRWVARELHDDIIQRVAVLGHEVDEIAGQTPTAWRLSALSSKPDDPPRN